ncbi:putative SLAM family member 5-like [Triplophysa rosa]|uniref:SLAM family member 5-like n=1 Tax=Triplophysa rosa TaxID=992332 RepID=A0A9W7W8H3_TRIRA|nr:putative SLAM family member 5-like [Triplophysa rosa]
MCEVIWICLYLWSLSGVFGTEFMPVKEGDSVNLPVNLTDHQRKHGISWKFGARGYLIAELSRGDGKVKTYEDQADGRFRDRLTLDQTGSLIITNITANDSGLYEVTNTSTNAKLNTFNITVHDHLSSVSSAWTFRIFYIIIPCAAAVGFLLVTALLIFRIRRKPKQSCIDKSPAVDDYAVPDYAVDKDDDENLYYINK